MIRAVSLLMLCLVVALGAHAPVEAATSVQMLVRAGFEGSGKVGGWLPVQVDIRNDGDDIEGELQIVVQDTATNRGTYTPAPTIYSAPVVLPRRARKQLQMEIRLPNTGQRIRSKLVQGDEILLEQDVQFSRVAAGDLFCGLLSRTTSALEFIATLEMPPPLRRVRVARMDLADVPSRPQLLSSLDCLVVANIPSQGLNEGQRDAMRTWVANGGLLIVAGGAGWQKNLAGLPSELLPVRVTGTATVDDLTNLADFGREPLLPGQYLASQATVVDGNSVVEQAGVPLIASVKRGLGTVFYLGLDPATDPLRSWPGSVQLWRYMLAHSTTSATLAPGGSTPFQGWGRIPRNALVDISPLSAPSPAPVAAGLVLLMFAIGPGNYLVLRRLGQPTWAMLTVPLVTGIAALLIFGLASANRDSDSIVTKVSVVRSMPSAPVAHSRTYVGLTTRQANAYTVRAAEGSLVYGQFYPFPRDPATEGPGWGLKVLGGSRPEVSELSLPAGSLATFTVDSQFRSYGGIETDLSTDGQSITGTVTNRTTYTLSDASLILDYNVTRLQGDLKPGETREVEIPLASAASAGYGPPNSFATSLYPSGLPQKKATDAARRDVLDSAFGQAFNFSKLELHGLTLLGWLETGALDLDFGATRPALVENTMYVASLPVKLPRGFEGDVPASLVTHRSLGATTASRQQFGSYDLAPGESVALQFSLPVHTGKLLLERLNINAEGRMRGPGAAAASVGDIQFYNWRTSEWEEQPFGLGTNIIANPLAYVSSTGDVRLRYTFRPPQDSGVTGVTFSRLDVNASGLIR